MNTIVDTDKSGHGFQKQKVWLGPSLGWSEEYVQPSSLITTPGTYLVQPGDGILLVDVAGPITIQLPDVRLWFQQPATQPATGWNRQLCIKDFGGGAQANNIVVQPFGGQRIDKNLGPVAITVNNAIFLLVPNVDLTGWVIAAGTTTVQLPVGTFLPVHNPRATGVLTVGDPGGDIAAIQGLAAGQQGVIYGVDAASADDAVNIHLIPKGFGGTLLYSNDSLQMQISGPANATEYLVVSGANGLDDPLIANASGQAIRMSSEILVGPSGGNFAGLQGSPAGAQSVAVRADSVANPDADINITLVPKGIGGCAFWSSGSLQAFVSGPAATTRYIQMSGSVSGNPLIQAAFGGVIEIPNLNMTGVPTAPTAAPGTNTTQVATTAFALANSVSLSGNNTFTGINQFNGQTFAVTLPITDSGAGVATTEFVQELLLANAPPINAQYITSAANVDLTAERVLTNTATITWDFTTPGQAKANSVGGGSGNVSNSGTPTIGQYGKWVTATTIQGVAPATVLSDIGAQPLDADLTALAALSGTNTIYYRSAANVWSPVTFSGLTFSGGVLTATASGGDVFLANANIFTNTNTFQGGGTTIQGLTGGNASVALQNFQAGTGSPQVNQQHSRGTTLGSHVVLNAADQLGQNNFKGSDGSAFVFGASIQVFCESAPTAGHVPSYMTFSTDNGTAFAERIRLNANGTFSPLTVQPTGSDGIQLTGVAGNARLVATGASADIGMQRTTKGIGAHYFYTANFVNLQASIINQAVAGYVQIGGGDGGVNLALAGGASGNRLGVQNSNLLGTARLQTYAVAALPTGSVGDLAYCNNCRVFNGAGVQEGAGAGTGGLVTHNGTAWKIAGTNVTAVA